MENMKFNSNRRGALLKFGAGLLISGIVRGDPAGAAAEATLASTSANSLRELSQRLAGMPRRRDFKAVPMILDNVDLWDAAPLNAVLAYTDGPKQAWDNTDLAGPWLKEM